MTKVEFYKKLAEKSTLTNKEVEKVMKAFDEVMLEDVFAAEDSVRLGIGTFSGYTKETSARKARNPRTGETIDVPAKTIKGYPKFKPSKTAKE